MRLAPILMLAALAAGCTRGAPAESQAARDTGRYISMGSYPAGEKWAALARQGVALATSDKAEVSDDEQVIVFIDSRSGEIRQCGNLSGYCVTLSPWNQQLGSTPVKFDPEAAATYRQPGPAIRP